MQNSTSTRLKYAHFQKNNRHLEKNCSHHPGTLSRLGTLFQARHTVLRRGARQASPHSQPPARPPARVRPTPAQSTHWGKREQRRKPRGPSCCVGCGAEHTSTTALLQEAGQGRGDGGNRFLIAQLTEKSVSDTYNRPSSKGVFRSAKAVHSSLTSVGTAHSLLRK